MADAAPSEEPQAEETGESQGKAPATTIPTSMFAGKEFNPGDEIVLKIVSIQGDRAVVEYATGEEEGGEEGPAAEAAGAPAAGAGDAYASMME